MLVFRRNERIHICADFQWNKRHYRYSTTIVGSLRKLSYSLCSNWEWTDTQQCKVWMGSIEGEQNLPIIIYWFTYFAVFNFDNRNGTVNVIVWGKPPNEKIIQALFVTTRAQWFVRELNAVGIMQHGSMCQPVDSDEIFKRNYKKANPGGFYGSHALQNESGAFHLLNDVRGKRCPSQNQKLGAIMITA